MTRLCHTLPPRREYIFQVYGKCNPECILPYAHWCGHVFHLSDGRHVQWEDDWDCGCCEPDEEDRCYDTWFVSEEEVTELIKEFS